MKKIDERLKIAESGGYHKDAIRATIKADYFRTLYGNGNNVGKTLDVLSKRYDKSTRTIQSVVNGS